MGTPKPTIVKSAAHTEEVKVEISEQQAAAMGKELAVKLTELDKLDVESAEFKAHMKSLKEPIVGRIVELKQVLKSGKEPREIKCQTVFDYPGKTVTTYRLDTDEVLRSRAMNEKELQRELHN